MLGHRIRTGKRRRSRAGEMMVEYGLIMALLGLTYSSLLPVLARDFIETADYISWVLESVATGDREALKDQ